MNDDTRLHITPIERSLLTLELEYLARCQTFEFRAKYKEDAAPAFKGDVYARQPGEPARPSWLKKLRADPYAGDARTQPTPEPVDNAIDERLIVRWVAKRAHMDIATVRDSLSAIEGVYRRYVRLVAHGDPPVCWSEDDDEDDTEQE